MYLIVGLGNPDPEYNKTRHNMGFHVIDNMAEECHIEISKKKFDGLYGTGMIQGEKVILIKPQTYMNLSGKCIVQFTNFYQVPLEHIIVIQDDIDTTVGNIRIRKKGGPGTHNGMKSVVEELGGQNFPRIRIGIGMPKYAGDLINHVLGSIPQEEYALLEKATKKGAKAAICIIKEGMDKAMNIYNDNRL